MKLQRLGILQQLAALRRKMQLWGFFSCIFVPFYPLRGILDRGRLGKNKLKFAFSLGLNHL